MTQHGGDPCQTPRRIAGCVGVGVYGRLMLDAEASRQTAHIFLDVAAIHDHNDPTDIDSRDEMTGLALQRLNEVGAILLTQDNETGQITLDIARAGTGIVAVIVACLDGWASALGVDRELVIAEVRAMVDEHLREDAED